jgi:hypothetical protein
MPTQLLIYETAVPVSNARHAKCFVETGSNYAFTRNVNSVPLMAVEFPEAAQEYAMVFAGTADQLMPVVILGARQNENLYVSADGQWPSKYIPAFVRRYPFVFSTSDDGKTFTLCVDEAFPGVNYQGRGRPLFSDDGKPSPYTDNVLKFLQEYRAQFLRTKAFCKKLKDLDLLETMKAEFTLGSGDKMALSGFMMVDRKRLKALGGDVLVELAKTDELELVYLHLQSMRNFNVVKDRLLLVQGGKAAQGSAAPAKEHAPEEPATAAAPDNAPKTTPPETPSKAAAGRTGKRTRSE